MATTAVESFGIRAGPTEVVALGRINRLDGYYAEEHRARVRTTEYPVETGADLTDHVVREPYRLKAQGQRHRVPAGHGRQGCRRGRRCWRTSTRGGPVAVVTRLGTYLQYDHWWITNQMVDDSTGLSLDIEIELKEILRANVTRGTVRPAAGRQRPGQRWTGAARRHAGRTSAHCCCIVDRIVENSLGGSTVTSLTDGSSRLGFLKEKPRTRRGWLWLGLAVVCSPLCPFPVVFFVPDSVGL